MGEVVGDGRTGAEVHLVRCLAIERSMRDARVVFDDVEGDEVVEPLIHLVGRLALERRVRDGGVVLDDVERDQRAEAITGCALLTAHPNAARFHNPERAFELVSIEVGDEQPHEFEGYRAILRRRSEHDDARPPRRRVAARTTEPTVEGQNGSALGTADAVDLKVIAPAQALLHDGHRVVPGVSEHVRNRSGEVLVCLEACHGGGGIYREDRGTVRSWASSAAYTMQARTSSGRSEG